MLYELLKNIRFNGDYTKIMNLLNSTDKIVIKNKPEEGYEIDYDLFGKYKDIVLEFVDIFETNFDQEKIDNMLKNLSKLRITTIVPLDRYSFLGTRSLGYYDSKNNELVVETKDAKHLKETIFHELLHMASTVKGTNDNYCGFNFKGIIGKGINEDYTEYLLEKYYGKEIDIYPRYNLLKQIEYLVGEKELEDYYFKGDLKLLIDALSKYDSKKEIIRLLYEYDLAYDMAIGYKVTQELERMVKQLVAKKEKEEERKHMM